MFGNEGPGVQIGDVTPGSAADEAGLQLGDYILSIDGQTTATPQDVRRQIRDMRPGDTVELTIWRNGTEHSITATLGETRRMVLQDRELSDDSVDYATGPYFTYYRTPVYGAYDGYYPGYYRYYGYYPRTPYYYGYPYSYGYRYYGAPRLGYYGSPWGAGVRVGPFRYYW